MPTHQDETLQQRYAREHHDYLKLCGSMTAEQVAELQLQLNNALAREQALQQRLNAADQRIDELTAAPVVERQDVLPCDVRVAPATTIRKGCKVETLMQCIELRKGQPDKLTRFNSSAPPAPVSVVLPERKREDPHDERQPVSEYHAECGWNACLDKVKQLNT